MNSVVAVSAEFFFLLLLNDFWLDFDFKHYKDGAKASSRS